jgi:hypothetical protein
MAHLAEGLLLNALLMLKVENNNNTVLHGFTRRQIIVRNFKKDSWIVLFFNVYSVERSDSLAKTHADNFYPICVEWKSSNGWFNRNRTLTCSFVRCGE